MRVILNPFTRKMQHISGDGGDIETGVIYIGNKNKDGTYRIIVSDNNFLVERRELGIWVEKWGVEP